MRRTSLIFFLLSSLLAAAAIAVQNVPFLGEPEHEMQVVLRSEILGEEVPFEALLLKGLGPELSLHVTLSKGATTEPHLFEATIIAPNESEARAKLASLKPQLTETLIELAGREARLLRENLQDIENDAAQQAETAEPVPNPKARLEPAFQGNEQETSLRLSTELRQLDSFLKGGSEPVWLGSRLDPTLLTHAQENLRQAEGDLAQLSSTYKDTSRIVQAQNKVVEQARQDLNASKKHLAKLLEESYKVQLSQLEQTTLSRIQANSKRLSADSALTASSNSPAKQVDPEWLESLDDEAKSVLKAIKEKAEVLQVQEPDIRLRPSDSYWWSLGLWLGAGASLLLGFFWSPAEKTKLPEKTPVRTSMQPTRTQEEMKPEPFLLQALESIEQELQRPLKRVLVLGQSSNLNRVDVSARLARSLSAAGKRVRLVDLDFEKKALSAKLGKAETVGVSDLPPHHNAIDEFLASVAGTRIEFAPAGRKSFSSKVPQNSTAINTLLNPPTEGILVVDASFSSPLESILARFEAVICVTNADTQWTAKEQETLLQVREANLPIWGLMQGSHGLYPFA